jgi:transcription-repair coupling factor (superfamily II helicase)
MEIYPAYEQYAIRIELFGDSIDRIRLFIHQRRGACRRGPGVHLRQYIT